MGEIDTELSFEERINNQRSARKKAFIVKLSCILFVFLILAIYFIVPFSHVSNTVVEGNVYYSKEQILKIAELNESESLYGVSKEKIIEKLNMNPLLTNGAKVDITPIGMKITVNEIYPIFNYDNGLKKFYFNNGEEVSQELLQSDEELIGQFLNENINKTIALKFEPDKSNISSKNYKSIVSILSQVSGIERDYIRFVDYDKSNNNVYIYFDNDGNSLLRFDINLTSNIYVEGAYKAINKDQIEKQKNSIKSKKMEPIVCDGIDVYAWTIVITENATDYQIGFIEVKEN